MAAKQKQTKIAFEYIEICLSKNLIKIVYLYLNNIKLAPFFYYICQTVTDRQILSVCYLVS